MVNTEPSALPSNNPWRAMVPRKLYPFKENYFRLGEHLLHYVDEGPEDGEPIVMVHGNPTWSFYFRNLIAPLSRDYRVLAPDHLGCGLSEKPSEENYGYRLEDRVRDFGNWIASLNLQRPVTLVLHDWGGMIGLTWARQNPHKVGRIVLQNTAGFMLPGQKKLPWSLRVLRSTPLGAPLTLWANAFVQGASLRCPGKGPLRDEVRLGFEAPYKKASWRTAVWRFVEDIPLESTDPSYSCVQATEASLSQWSQTPVLILWGEKDFVFDNAFLNQWREYLPQAKVHTFAEGGHYLLEDAHQSCMNLISSFLQQNPTNHRLN